MSNNNFPEERAKQLIDNMTAGKPNEELITIYYSFVNSLLGKNSYVRYPRDLQEDMVSRAVYEWLKYGQKYNPSKGKVFSFWTRNAENSFKWVLKNHYKHVNIEKLIMDTIQDREDLLILEEDSEED